MFDFRMIKNKKAQIVLPAILLIPTILLVIYLLFETAKLSREKIRHQFALDTSAFVELTTASNYLNATAYVNGAFPFRLMAENLEPNNPMFPLKGAEEKELTLYELFYKGGAFPALGDEENPLTARPKDSDTEWEITYYDGEGAPEERQSWNSPNPPSISDSTYYPIMSKTLADQYGIGWNPDALKMYLLIYHFLSGIYEDQKTVYLRLSKEGEFFRKGYYLNTGDCKMSECGREGAKFLKGYVADTEPVYVKKIKFYYVNPDDTTDETKEITMDLETEDVFDGKLFQYAYVGRGYANKLRKLHKGIDIVQPFKAPSNYFNVSLERFRPRNHVRVALQCGKEMNNCVWPNPTPKYQVRIFP